VQHRRATPTSRPADAGPATETDSEPPEPKRRAKRPAVAAKATARDAVAAGGTGSTKRRTPAGTRATEEADVTPAGRGQRSSRAASTRHTSEPSKATEPSTATRAGAAGVRDAGTLTARKAAAARSGAKKPSAPENSSAAEKKKTVNQTAAKAAPALPVRPGEDPWTEEEIAELRADLQADITRQTAQIEIVNSELAGLLRDGNDGAGRDPADVGSTNFERDQEMSLAANAREMLLQSVEALKRIDAGTYGICENCRQPIGKGRLQAFPRATLCVTCKQREERR